MANIAEILKNTPKGLKLYSTVYGEVELVENDGSMLSLKNPAGIGLWLDEYGKKSEEGECLLFPSKDHRTWEDWMKALIPKCIGSIIVPTVCCFCNYEWIVTNNGMFAMNMSKIVTGQHPFKDMCYDDLRFATPKETEVFFERLDKLGYKFENGEVVKKEKEWSIYDAKDGDFVYDTYNGTVFIFKEINSQKELMEYVSYPSLLDFTTQKKSNGIHHSTLGNYYDEKQYRLATTEELQLLLGKLNDAGYYWDSDRKIISRIYEEPEKTGETEKKFTIDDFKPFDKVLVRDDDGSRWNINLFSNYVGTSDYPYRCLTGGFAQCVPYNEDTVHLLGGFVKYNGKYKTWED